VERRGRARRCSGDTHSEPQKPDDANATVAEQKRLQREVAGQSKKAHKPSPKAMQAGAREYPAPPLPKQKQEKPGDEAALTPAPFYDAPYYRGSEKLKDKVAIVTGGDSGIGRAVAVLFAREGADVAVLYLSEDQDAEETRRAVEAEGRRALLIAGDVRERAFCGRWRGSNANSEALTLWSTMRPSSCMQKIFSTSPKSTLTRPLKRISTVTST
jgi:hypothetical protein